jgi:cobalt-zinc-cadmium efflux system protein
MSSDHGHDHGASALRSGARNLRPLLISFGLIVGFLVVQVVTGIVTGSLALLSDAGHMATDALGLGMALAAIQAASTARAHPQRTFGLYRLEILAALVNAALLFGVAGYVLYEAVARLSNARDVASTPVLIVGTIGLAVNMVAFLLLRAGAKDSLNMQGAYL